MNLKQIREMLREQKNIDNETPAFWIYAFEGKFIFDSWENPRMRCANAFDYMTKKEE